MADSSERLDFTEWMLRNPTHYRLTAEKNLALGSAAFSTVFLLSMLTLESLSMALWVGSIAAAVNSAFGLANMFVLELVLIADRKGLAATGAKKWELLNAFGTLPTAISPVVIFGSITFHLGVALFVTFCVASVLATTWLLVSMFVFEGMLQEADDDTENPSRGS